MKFLRRTSYTNYIADQSDTVGVDGGTITIVDIPKTPATALEVEIEGKRYILLAYEKMEVADGGGPPPDPF